MINVDDWAEIRRLYFAERLGIKTIATQLGVARNTVRTAVRGSAPPDYKRESRGSLVDAVEKQICELLRDCPTMPATVIAERIEWECRSSQIVGSSATGAPARRALATSSMPISKPAWELIPTFRMNSASRPLLFLGGDDQELLAEDVPRQRHAQVGAGQAV